MGKPAKIRKKKSFMFTTKHNSFTGILGLVIAICTLLIVITIIMYSYGQAGNVPAKFGMLGLSLAVLNLIGVISGIIGVKERDVFITPPIISIVVNFIMLAGWTIIVVLAN